MDTPAPVGAPPYLAVDFDRTPFTVAWEITRACALACIHCRAEAIPRRDPHELSTGEAMSVLDQIVEIGRPILVITGGDPMMRRDVFEILGAAVVRGLKVGFSPSATPLLTRQAIARIRQTGVDMVHLSVDGSSPRVHDAFRGVRGSFDRTIGALRGVTAEHLPLQIGTTVTRHNVDDLPAIADLVAAFGTTVWSVFFLVPTGRAHRDAMLTAREHEDVLHWLADLSDRAPFRVRTTAAQHFRRVLVQRARARPRPAGTHAIELTGAGYAFREGRAPAAKGVNDGKGFCFISHVGDVYPSGFLQYAAGNVREATLSSIYRDAPIMRQLRDPALLKGKCGRCEFRDVCGGSRARAWAVTGDYLAEEPCCLYEPH
ncbi:MAG TPA: TIGR04053 family radical SAM/SPASM domain-containing protein [Dehalococcoidia bacterium]|nr:TIGR04053 family radical SAM/SPASM domain-containing protein [Dehalococcoidia bacterium]